MLKEKETVSDEFCWHLSNFSTVCHNNKSIFSQPSFCHDTLTQPGVLSSVKRLDAGGEEWQAVPSMPSARRLCTATACNGALGNMDISIWMFPKMVYTPKSSILIGFSIINHSFWGTPVFGNTHIHIVFVWNLILTILLVTFVGWFFVTFLHG